MSTDSEAVITIGKVPAIPRIVEVGDVFENATLLNIVDGDTYDFAVIGINGRISRLRVRLNLVDTPEKNPRISLCENDQTLVDKQKLASTLVVEQVKRILEKSESFRLVIAEIDSFGRAVSDVNFFDKKRQYSISLAPELIRLGLAREYSRGSTRIGSWTRESIENLISRCMDMKKEVDLLALPKN